MRKSYTEEREMKEQVHHEHGELCPINSTTQSREEMLAEAIALIHRLSDDQIKRIMEQMT